MSHVIPHILPSRLPAGVSVVVPVYNAEQSLRILTDRLVKLLRETGKDFEILFVDDGSRDNSWNVIGALAASHPFVRGFQMMRNYGQHNALLCGIMRARYSVVVTMDDDLQNPPEEVPKLLAKLDSGLDVVYGVPERETHGLLRDLASQITKITLQRAMGAQTARHVSAFRAFRTQLRWAFENYRGSYVSIDVLLTWGTANFGMLHVKQAPRIAGTSSYTVGKLLTHALNMITGFTTIPLQFASIVGLVFTCFGLFVLCFVLLRYLLQGSMVPGFPFLASLITIFSGAQLFALGIFGEYLARIHLRTMDRPSYAVRSTTELP